MPLTMELMLTTLPPAGLKYLTASCVVRTSPSTFKLNCRLKCSVVMFSNGGEFVNAGVVHENIEIGQRPSSFR